MKRSFAERLYALSLYLYPSSFRREFGEEMKQAFRDRLREDHSRGGRLLLAVTRDTLSSVTREHFQVENNALRICTILVLLFGVATVVLHGESLRLMLVDRVIAHQESSRKASFEEYDRAIHDYDAAIADQFFDRSDVRSQLIAAEFYGESFDYFGAHYDQEATAYSAQVAHRKHLAGDAFANALLHGWSDPAILWTAVARCPAQPAICRAAEAFEQLKVIAPQNGAVWWLELAAADHDKDTKRARAAIIRLAASSEFTVYENAMTALWLTAYAAVPPPQHLSAVVPDIVSADDDVVADGLNTRLHYLEWSIAVGGHAFEKECHTDDVLLVDACRRAATVLVRSDIFAARFIGLRALARLEGRYAAHWREVWRTNMWSRALFWKLLYAPDPADPIRGPHSAQQWLAALRANGTVVAAAEALRTQTGQVTAPADWPDGWPDSASH